jgi:IS5 family transposase
MSNFSDRETIQNIQENVYMQYFLGYSSFRNEAPFDASLFVEIRKRLGREQLEKINDEILGLNQSAASIAVELRPKEEEQGDGLSQSEDSLPRTTPTHKGKLITDATACPQDIAYPTDLNLLNDARVQSESIIDELYKLRGLDKKPRTYRKKARNQYLQTAQKKIKQRRSSIKQSSAKNHMYAGI